MWGANISPSVLAELDKLDAALVLEAGLRLVELRVDSSHGIAELHMLDCRGSVRGQRLGIEPEIGGTMSR